MSRRRKASPTANENTEEDVILPYVVHDASQHEKSKTASLSRCYRRPIIWVIFALLIVSYTVFVFLRRTLRSRPAWIYGKPMLVENLASCLESEVSSTVSTPSVLWEWHNYTSTSNQSHPTVLIAQYSGFGEYAKFLNLISPVHQQYAKQNGYDYVILQGTLLDFPGIRQDCSPNPRATFDKIPLLAMALSLKKSYDYVLILDTDAMIVDFDVAWSKLLPSHQLLAAQRVWRYDWKNTWDINAGITLWNLHHPDLETVLQRWKLLSQHGGSSQSNQDHRETILTKNDDQYFLQTALLELGWNRPIVSTTKEFNYYKGTVVKHFKRDKRSWSTNGLEQRLQRVEETIQQQICGDNEPEILADYCATNNTDNLVDYSKREPLFRLQ